MAAQKVVVEGSDITASQLADFFRQIADGSLNGLEIRALLDGQQTTMKSPFVSEDMELMGKAMRRGKLTKETLQECLEHRFPHGIEKIVIDWEEVYRLLGIDWQRVKDIGNVGSPGDVWKILVLPGVTITGLVNALRSIGVETHYPCDYDPEIASRDIIHARDPYFDGAYVISFPRTFAGVNIRGSKYETFMAKNQPITLPERLLLELGYVLATGRRLDPMNNACVCAGTNIGPDHNPWNPFVGRLDNDLADSPEFWVGHIGRAWDADYGAKNIRTHVAIKDSFARLR